MPKQDKHRPLFELAKDIRKHWPKVYFGAVPYLDAMGEIDQVVDRFHAEDGKSMVIYFLANATTWRGEEAKRIKAELKAAAGLK